MSDQYLRSKYLARLAQHQKLLKTRINPEKYWGFVKYLEDHFKITGLDVDLRKMVILGRTIFKINLELYFEKDISNTYEKMRQIFQLYFYEPHDVLYGQDYMFITLNEDHIKFNPNSYYSSFGVHNTL